MRVIIRCAGGNRRWGNHLGIPKHLAPINGETLLGRAVRLTNELAPDADVRVVVRDLSDRRYLVAGSRRTVDKPTPDNGDVDKVVSTAGLWDRRGRTVTLFGDVWWAREDLASILHDPVDRWGAWLRFGPGGYGGEIFGFAFDPDAHDEIRDACDQVAKQHQAGHMNGIPGGWALYRTLCGRPVNDHRDHGHSHPVGAWTDDMDTPEDWDDWCWRWATTPPARRPS